MPSWAGSCCKGLGIGIWEVKVPGSIPYRGKMLPVQEKKGKTWTSQYDPCRSIFCAWLIIGLHVCVIKQKVATQNWLSAWILEKLVARLLECNEGLTVVATYKNVVITFREFNQIPWWQHWTSIISYVFLQLI